MLSREFVKLIELVHAFICIIWLCQLGRSRLLWIIWFFCIFASTNNWNSLFPIWHIKSHQYFKNVFILSPILQEPLLINLTSLKRFFTGTQYQLFGDSWAQTCLRQMNQKSSVSWDRDCPRSFRSASKLVQNLFHPGPEPGASPVQGDRGWARICSHQQQWWMLPFCFRQVQLG